eukprot:335701-Ditylum_brightwellii.AAC.2
MDDWGILLVDTRNAFNKLNWKAMLWHVQHYWLSGCCCAFNIHKHWKVYVLRGCALVIMSKEGVTDGDPMAMFLYAIGVLPIVEYLKPLQICNTTKTPIAEQLQPWHADDSADVGVFITLKEWVGTGKMHSEKDLGMGGLGKGFLANDKKATTGGSHGILTLTPA